MPANALGHIGQDFVRRTPFVYRRVVRFMQAMEDGDLDFRRRLSAQRVGEIVAAARRSPRYRDLGAPAGYEAWPHATKEQLREAPDAFLVSSLLPTTEAATSGSSGTPVRLRRSWLSVVAEQAAVDLFARRAGVSLRRARVAVLRGDSIKDPSDLRPPFWRHEANGRRLVLSSNHLFDGTVDAYLAELRRFSPEVLWVYPTALEVLCRLAAGREAGLADLRLIFSSSEVLPSRVRLLAGELFGVSVFDRYGQAERVALATSERPDEYRFSAACARVELERDHEADDHDLYEIVGTALWNSAQPLIRYRTGDLAKLPKGLTPAQLDEVCYGVRPFLGVSGRRDDYLLSPDGVRLVGIDHIPRGIDEIIQMQIVQTSPSEVVIRVVPGKGYSPRATDKILEQARSKIPESMRLDVETVTRLERTAQSKVPFVIRRRAND